MNQLGQTNNALSFPTKMTVEEAKKIVLARHPDAGVVWYVWMQMCKIESYKIQLSGYQTSEYFAWLDAARRIKEEEAKRDKKL